MCTEALFSEKRVYFQRNEERDSLNRQSNPLSPSQVIPNHHIQDTHHKYTVQMMHQRSTRRFGKFQLMAGHSQNVIDVFLPERLLHVANGQSTNPRERPRIQKVPPLLRLDNGEQDYDPLVVSLGPYHHGKAKLQLAENFKLKALEMFVADVGKDVQFFYTKVLEQVNFCRSCYFQDSTSAYDDPTFAQMMLLDTCFIINYILSINSWDTYNATSDYLGELVYVTVLHDLFLLENQMPFRFLKLLICLGYGDERGENLLNDFMYGTLFQKYKKWSGLASRDDDRPFHLLDAFWLIITSQHSKEKRSLFPCYVLGWLKHIGNISRCSHVGNCIAKFPWLTRTKKDDDDQNLKTNVYLFRSATDLKEKGIHFRPSSVESMRGIKFKSGYFFAKLEVPVWYVSNYTKVFFLNMIAYELCPNPTIDRAVTAYIDFMKSLIDNPTDVKELREKRILLTTLGSDEEVVNLYREVQTYDPSNVFIYENVKLKIEAHYNNKAKTWLAELLHTYFRSPWTAIALLAATLLLILTFLQTYYTVAPSPDKK